MLAADPCSPTKYTARTETARPGPLNRMSPTPPTHQHGTFDLELIVVYHLSCLVRGPGCSYSAYIHTAKCRGKEASVDVHPIRPI